jgi:hypothetical protein
MACIGITLVYYVYVGLLDAYYLYQIATELVIRLFCFLILRDVKPRKRQILCLLATSVGTHRKPQVASAPCSASTADRPHTFDSPTVGKTSFHPLRFIMHC